MEIRRKFISFRASIKKRGRGCEIKTNEGEDWQGRAGRGETIHVMNHTFGLELIQPAPGLLWQEGGPDVYRLDLSTYLLLYTPIVD